MSADDSNAVKTSKQRVRMTLHTMMTTGPHFADSQEEKEEIDYWGL